MMEVTAYLKGARLSPQKACLVADLVRGKDVDKALDILNFSKQKGASLIKKLLNSAISNAENNEKMAGGSDVPPDTVSEPVSGGRPRPPRGPKWVFGDFCARQAVFQFF